MTTSPSSSTTPNGTSFGGQVIRGSMWSTLQILVNKIVTVGATLVFAHYLAPADFGAANIATSLGAFVFVLAPWVFNDILIARARHYGRLSGTAFWVSLGFGAISSAILLALAPVFQRTHPAVDGLWGLLCVAATRPIADALLSVPWARLRLDLAYRKLALIDGGLQLAWTVASVVMAMNGSRALVLVLPPIAVLFGRALVYWLIAGREIPLRPHREELAPLCRTFLVATSGQYMNNIIQIMELLVLGWLASETSVGLFAFAFQLSSQTNAIIGAQISNVLQPVFSQIQQDPGRQISGFVRSIRYMGIFAVPISLIQAAVGPPVFALLFGAKWAGAVPAFLLLCVAQAFMFLAGPTVVLLKAQGRFRAFFAWQAVQVVAGSAVMYLSVRLGSETAGRMLEWIGVGSASEAAPALAIACASAAVWGMMCPISIWIGTRHTADRPIGILQLIAEPWIVSLPIALVVALLPIALHPIFPKAFCDWFGMLVLAPVGLSVAVVILVRRDPPMWAALTRHLARRLPVRQDSHDRATGRDDDRF